MWHPVQETWRMSSHILQAKPRPSFAERVSLGTQVPPLALPHSIPEWGEVRGWGQSASKQVGQKFSHDLLWSIPGSTV
ncbi:hypothetical protein ANAPC2_01451 [Anaplasma phagocytophilum]|mgnify:CR=1 FL=1|jgi:hypothetical protein|nr:hypothetical protein ANAPC2_01451 [Anaplasma phagocytophilum]